MTLPVSLDRAFSVFEDPYNLEAITPPWLNFSILNPTRVQMRAGAVIEYRLRWQGIPLRWKTLISRYEPPLAFVDEALHSPYTLWHHLHWFEATPRGTRVGDRVDYALPFGPLGALAHSLVVARQLRGIFRFRQRAIATLLGCEPLDLSEPAIHSR